MTSTRSTTVPRRAGAWLAAAALGAGLAAVPAPATAAKSPAGGERALATVLTSDGNRFDRNPRDYDIVTEAVLAVLAAKPGSDVGVLTDGSARLTAFLPRDEAFRLLVQDLTGHRYKKEKRVFNQLARTVGIDAIESVLLYHVVPGKKINAKKALQSDGAELTTALGSTFTVDVVKPAIPKVRLVDNDPDDYDPRLAPGQLDINKGNKQIAHGITRVLRPLDL
jgi:hypothetical protein